MPMEQSDHDLLIQANTRLEMLISTQGQYLDQYGKLLERVVAIEIQRNRDSARVDAIKEDMDDLSRKSSVIDAINAIMAGIAGIVGFIFGNR